MFDPIHLNRIYTKIKRELRSDPIDGGNPQWPIFKFALGLIAFGYILYALARWHIVTSWVKSAVELATPAVGALVHASWVAQQTGRDPLPAQIVILYGALGSIVWTGWFSYIIWRWRRQLTDDILRRLKALDVKPSKSQLIAAHITILAGAIVSSYGLFWWTNYQSGMPSWSDVAIFSGSLHSATFLIFASIVTALATPWVVLMFYIVINKLD